MAAATRKPGHPAKGQRVITELDYPEIYRRWLRGGSVHAIARQYEVNWSTANHHLQRCREMMRSAMFRDRAEVLDELSEVRAAAWECFDKSKRPVTHDEVQKELDKLKSEGKAEDDVVFRVAKQVTKISTRDGEATWLSVVLAAIEVENKLLGHYEAGKREGQSGGKKCAYRVAGQAPGKMHDSMMQRLAEVLSRRREALVGGSN